MDPRGLRRRGGRRRDRAHAGAVEEVRGAAGRRCATSGSIDVGRPRRAQPRRCRRRPTTTLDARRAGARPDVARDDHLHLRHDRSPQGLRADPRQLPRPRREHLRVSSPRSCEATARRRCSSCRWRTCSRASSRSLCVEAAARMGHSTDIRPCSTTSPRSSRPSSSPCPRVFEKIYNSAEAKATADGKGRIFAAAAATRDRLERGARRRRPRSRAAAPARGVRPAGLRQAARRHGRSGAVRRVRRRAARHPPRPLLPRHRRHRPRGLRPHRDHGSRRRSTSRTKMKIGTVGPPLPGVGDPDRRRRRDPAQGRQRLPRLPQQRRRDGGGDPRRLVPHRRHRRARRRRLPADHRSQEGDPRDRRRQERRPRGARGPAPRPPARRRSASSSATRSRSSPRSSPSTRRCCPPGPRTTASPALTVEQARTNDGGARRAAEGGRRRQQRGLQGRVDPQVRGARRATSPRRTATSRRR